MKYNKIALIGMMGSGKSTIAKQLAKELGFKLLELDEIFEEQENSTISDYFKNFGEENFRKIESKILGEALKKENIILSTGGGVILKKENRDLLFQNNILTIYLETNVENIYDRIKNDEKRPLLKVKNPKNEIENILNNRIKYYSQAKYKINTNDKTIENIIEEIKQWTK